MKIEDLVQWAEELRTSETFYGPKIDGKHHSASEGVVQLADALRAEKMNRVVAVSNCQMKERDLLKRYMEHVKMSEGITFCDRLDENDKWMQPFTEEEKEMLIGFAKGMGCPLT